ncbi:MAG TPA: pitrilysin family protein [Acidimicrobiales bacterium]
MRVVTEHLPQARSVALGCWVGVGNRDEPPPHAGVSHFLEHLAFKGTAQRDARTIAESVDATGGEINAFTTKEYTGYELRLPARHLPFAIELLCDVVANPALRPPDVDSERAVILEELHLQNDEPDDVVHTELYSALFPGHPLGWEIVGTEDTITAMSPDAIRAFHDRWYRPANLVIAAAGPFEHDELVEAVAAHFDSSEVGERPVRAAPDTSPEPRRSVRRRAESAHVALGWRALSHDDDDRYALAVANQLVGVGLSSRLFQAVREQRGLAYSVYSSVTTYADTGVFSVYAATMPAKVQEVLDVVRAELDDIVAHGPTAQELAVAKGAFEGSTLINLEDTGSRMARLATSVVLRDRVTPLDEFLARVAAVTVDDVQRVAQRVLGVEPTLATVGPDG